MPWYQHAIDGGWNTEAGPIAPTITRGDVIVVPFLLEAQNVTFAADGWPIKMPGASNVITDATGASDAVVGIFDYWRSTSTGSPVQRRLVYSGDEIFTNTPGETTLTSLASGLETGIMPDFNVMNDLLVISSSSTVDVPRSWNQTTFQNLAGSPPNFDFMATHKLRGWAMGAQSNKSRLYYTVQDNPADWTSTGSGSIDIEPDDGDIGTGLASHKDDLWVFKGPNKGSIHRITGSAPTGADAFARIPFVRGVGAASHQSIIRVRDDLWFWDDYGIHSLVATAAFGDFNETFLSAPIASHFIQQLNHSRLRNVWGINFGTAGYALWTASTAGAATHDIILGLDYRFTPPRFFRWPAYAVASLAMVVDASRETVPWCGTYAGRVRRMNRPSRNLGGGAYTGLVRWPYLTYGDPVADKVVTGARIGIAPKGATTFTLGWTRDQQTQQTESITQGGGATLGTSADQFALDEDTLGGGNYVDQFATTLTGSFKGLQLELSQGTVDVEMEPHSLSLEIEGAGVGLAAILG